MCDKRCKECTSYSECVSCPIDRYMIENNACQCMLGYYENGTKCERKISLVYISVR